MHDYLLDKFGHDAFGFTIGVDVGSVDRVDAEVPRGFEDLEGRFFLEDPRLDEGILVMDVDIARRRRWNLIRTLHFDEPKLMAPSYDEPYHVKLQPDLCMGLTMGTETRRPDLPS